MFAFFAGLVVMGLGVTAKDMPIFNAGLTAAFIGFYFIDKKYE